MEWLDGMFDGMLDGMLEGRLDGMVDGVFGCLDRMMPWLNGGT